MFVIFPENIATAPIRINTITAARSISHRVKDEVEQATGLKVARVIVSVDDVIA